MNEKKIFGWVFIVLGILGLTYGDISDTASVITMGIGVYLLVNSKR